MLAFALTKNDEGVNVYKQIEKDGDLSGSVASLGVEVFRRAHDSPGVLSILLRYNEVNHNIVSYALYEEKFRIVEKIQIDKEHALEIFYHFDKPNKNPII